MNTDFGSSLVCAVILIICILPFVFLFRGKNKRQKKLFKVIKSMATDNGYELGKFEIFTNFAIGVDAKNNFLFFYKEGKSCAKEYRIALNEIKDCKIIQTDKVINHDKKRGFTVDKLELNLLPYSAQGSEISIEFFNTEDNLPLYSELSSLKSWKEYIQKNLQIAA